MLKQNPWTEERLCSIYVNGSLKSLILELQMMKQRYGAEGYANLHIKPVRDCGHPFHCECSETPYLFGVRP